MQRPRRSTFFDLQARHRRSAALAGAACFVVVATGGMATSALLVFHLGLVLFTLAFLPAVALLAAGFALHTIGAGDGVTEPLWHAARALLGAFGRVVDVFPFDDPRLLLPAAITLPSLAWLAVSRVWRLVGSGETLLHLGAREPRGGDPEERQLANVVAEMAVAAGAPPPRVLLVDAGGANAAAVGTSPGDAHVVVTRPLLERLDRAQTQAVLGHLIASVCDGDLRLGATIQAAFYVLELLTAVALAPFARQARSATLRWAAFFAVAPALEPAERAERARALVHALEQHRSALRAQRDSDGGAADPMPRREYLGPVGAVLVRLCPPLLALVLLAVAASDLLALAASFPIALLWRSRRYLADATSIELARNPEALAGALERMAADAQMPPGGEREAHLVVVARSASAPGGLAARHQIALGLHPPLARRLRRLRP